MGKISFSLILALAVVTVGTTSEKKCVLSGMWKNELQSLMEIHDVNDEGEFSGEYLTSVTATSNCIRRSPLKGAQHDVERRAQPTFGFTVNWEPFSNSTTIFVGQCFLDGNGKEILETVWLLREQVDSPREDWKATRVGTNIFTRKRNAMRGKILQDHSPPCEVPAPTALGTRPPAPRLPSPPRL